MRIVGYCCGLQIAHTHKDVSIGFYPGAVRGAWKHAPVIPLPRHDALLRAYPPYFSDKSKAPMQLVLLNTKTVTITSALVTRQSARHCSASPIAC